MPKQKQVYRALIALIVSVPMLFIAMQADWAHAAPRTDAMVSGACGQTEFDSALATVQSSAGGTISFSCPNPMTITFTTQKTIDKNVIINGGTLGMITLSGGGASLFQILGSGQLTLFSITLANASSFAAAIENFGTLTLSNSIMTNNHNNGGSTSTGGAVYNSGAMFVDSTTFSNNSAGNGGAIYIEGGASASLTSSTVFSNAAASLGAGIYNGGTITLTNSILSSNVITQGIVTSRGGGAFNAGQYTMNGGSIFANYNISPTTTQFTGGGLHNGNGSFAATMNLTNVTLNGNSASSGGGIYNWESTLILKQSTVVTNSGGVTAGGINNSGNSAILIVYNSRILTNTSGTGGGIYNNSSTSGANAVISQTLISGNTAGFGGGLRNYFGSFMSVYQSLVASNSVATTGFAARGGGVANRGLFYAENTTFSGNIADDNLGTSQGGAILSEGNSSLTLRNVTISDNKANTAGSICTNGTITGPCGSGGSTASSDLGNTILNASRDPDTNALNDNCVVVSMIDQRGNIESTSSCLLSASLTGTDPKLNLLADNGGPTRSHLPKSNSPAINNGTGLTGCPAVDQRGVSRPNNVSNPCDSGAVEVQPTVYLPLIIR